MVRPPIFPSALLIVAILSLHNVVADDGDRDSGFGSEGQVMIERPPDVPTVNAPTGDIASVVGGGFVWAMSNGDGTVWVGRGRRDGSADPEFGDDGSGHVSIDLCAANAPVRVLSDLDGAVIVWNGACLLRLLENGTLDENFGSLAAVSADFAATGLARDGEGRWVLAGSTENDWEVMRFLHNGLPDADFGRKGGITITLPDDSTQQGLNALAVRQDGRIALAGWRSHAQDTDLVVIQLDALGGADDRWNGTGTVDLEPPPGQFAMVATAAALDRDGIGPRRQSRRRRAYRES